MVCFCRMILTRTVRTLVLWMFIVSWTSMVDGFHWSKLNLPEEHIPYYLHSHSNLRTECKIDHTCPFKVCILHFILRAELFVIKFMHELFGKIIWLQNSPVCSISWSVNRSFLELQIVCSKLIVCLLKKFIYIHIFFFSLNLNWFEIHLYLP